MSITLNQLLEQEYFSSMKVVAGQKGLSRPLGGIAILDAPDGLQWAKGNELVLSSGYVFAADPGLFGELVKKRVFDQIAALGVKMRFLSGVPDYVLDFFNKNDIPLLIVSDEYSWPECIHQFNTMVIRQAMQLFDIREGELAENKPYPYDEGKIARILTRLEYATLRPVMLYDVHMKNTHYSSSRFKAHTHLVSPEEYLREEYMVAKENTGGEGNLVYCEKHESDERLSQFWVKASILIEGEKKAYLVVLGEMGDFNTVDRMMLTVAQSLVKTIYERKQFSILIREYNFERLVRDCIENRGQASKKILASSKEYGIDLQRRYRMVFVSDYRADLLAPHDEALKRYLSKDGVKRVVLGDHEVIYLLPEKNNDESWQEDIWLRHLQNWVDQEWKEYQADLGIILMPVSLLSTHINLNRCRRIVSTGKRIYPQKKLHDYGSMGPFAWIDVDDADLTRLLQDLTGLFQDDNQSMILTLKTYLDCKMNYSLTAEKLYLHINTVRKRMELIREMIPYDMGNPLERLKLEMMLSLLDVSEIDP